MPTAAKLFAAIAYGMVGFFAASEFVRVLPENMTAHKFWMVATAIGILCGWRIMGKYAHRGYRDAIAFGFYTTAVMVFFTMLSVSIYEMLRRSTRLEYDGVMDSLEATFELMMDFIFIGVESIEGMIILVVGGVLAAWFSVWAAKRWK